MGNVVKEIEKSARRLSAQEREILASRLFESVHNKELNDIDKAWLAVAETRSNAYLAKIDPGITEEDFFDRIEKNSGWR